MCSGSRDGTHRWVKLPEPESPLGYVEKCERCPLMRLVQTDAGRKLVG